MSPREALVQAIADSDRRVQFCLARRDEARQALAAAEEFLLVRVAEREALEQALEQALEGMA